MNKSVDDLSFTNCGSVQTNFVQNMLLKETNFVSFFQSFNHSHFGHPQIKHDAKSMSTSSEDSASRKSSIESVSSTDSTSSTGSANDVVMSDASTDSKTMPSIQENNISNGTSVEKPVNLARSTSTPNGDKSDSGNTSSCTNNNSLPKEVSMEELELLKKLEAANR